MDSKAISMGYDEVLMSFERNEYYGDWAIDLNLHHLCSIFAALKEGLESA